jgi:parallel beta-helix repeat protein
VSVSGDVATITVSFAENSEITEKTYSIGISPGSTLIKGSGTVTVTQAARVALNAYYVSFSGGDDANAGTEAAPWKTIARVNQEDFEAGDAILFKSGDTWSWDENTMTGSDFLAPKGSSEAGKPITISSYGNGEKPKLEGRGLVNNVIRLNNQQYWEISRLEISNMVEGWTNPMSRTDTQGDLIHEKDLRGIYLTGDNGTVLNGFNMHDLYIHDVTGHLYWIGGAAYIATPQPVSDFSGMKNQTGWDASKRTGAIFAETFLGDGINPTTFNTIIVENNVLERNSFSGFSVKQHYGGNAGVKWAFPSNNQYPYNDSNFKPHTNITVRGNYIDQTGWYHGDGIYLTSVQNALVEKNVVKNPGVSGIELYYCDSITVQYNEVYGTTAKGGGNDTNGIDPDVRTSNIIIQYNYVHDCGDGFLICGGQYNTVIIRYNVLYNNTRNWIRDVVDRGIIQVYNNILYNTKAQEETPGTIRFTGFRTATPNNERWEFKNNVFYNAHPGTTLTSFMPGSHTVYANNLYYGVTPPTEDPAPITGAVDALFAGAVNFTTGTSAAAVPTNFDFLKPAAGSPLINQGTAFTPDSTKIDSVPNNQDYAGVTLSGKDDIGIFAADFNGLSGVVTNFLDDPISGAVVKLAEGVLFTTGADGKYTFTDVNAGSYTITVTADNYMDSTTPFEVNAGSVSWLPLKTGDFTGSSTKTVSGTVTSGDSPLSGATVTISKGGTDYTGTTGADGTYRIENVPSGTGYTITASKNGYESRSLPDFVVPLMTEADPVDFDLISSTHVYYDEPFDTLDDWQIAITGDSVVEIIVDPDNGENNLLHISKSAAGNKAGIFNKTNAGAYGIFTIETRLKRSISQSSGTGQMHMYTYQANKFTGDGSANPSANIVMVGGQIKTHLATGSSSVTNMQAYSANTWYEITLRVDTATDTFVFYIDGEQKGSGNMRTSVDEIDIFNITSGGTGSGFGDFWVDYIKVYQGEPQNVESDD